MEFSKQEYWNGLPFPTSGHLPDPGIKPMSPASPALAGRLFTIEPPGKPYNTEGDIKYGYEKQYPPLSDSPVIVDDSQRFSFPSLQY